jgi:hypothetical protein
MADLHDQHHSLAALMLLAGPSVQLISVASALQLFDVTRQHQACTHPSSCTINQLLHHSACLADSLSIGTPAYRRWIRQ